MCLLSVFNIRKAGFGASPYTILSCCSIPSYFQLILNMFSLPAMNQQIRKPDTRLFQMWPMHFITEFSFWQQGRQVNRTRLKLNTPLTRTYTGMKFSWVHSFRYFAPEGMDSKDILRTSQQLDILWGIFFFYITFNKHLHFSNQYIGCQI